MLGQFKSASNPVLRDTHEYILIFLKVILKGKEKIKKIPLVKKILWSGVNLYGDSHQLARRRRDTSPFSIRATKAIDRVL
ncbi:hypothetical protein [Helicobacter muridarum]|uniref:hypothetical protein n=1 Tax=Helicobacter muridarum TaxID=216 RepID=UPI000B270EA2|nr:hypothetical protein [Helicobacter muridarum]